MLSHIQPGYPEEKIGQKDPVRVGKIDAAQGQDVRKLLHEKEGQQTDAKGQIRRDVLQRPQPEGHEKIKLHDDHDVIKGGGEVAQEQIREKFLRFPPDVADAQKTEVIDHHPQHIGEINFLNALEHIAEISAEGDLRVHKVQGHFDGPGVQKHGHHKSRQAPGKVDDRRLPGGWRDRGDAQGQHMDQNDQKTRNGVHIVQFALFCGGCHEDASFLSFECLEEIAEALQALCHRLGHPDAALIMPPA